MVTFCKNCVNTGQTMHLHDHKYSEKTGNWIWSIMMCSKCGRKEKHFANKGKTEVLEEGTLQKGENDK